jgi:hypothetical protein
MLQKTILAMLVALATGMVGVPQAHAGDVSLGITIGTPPPPPAFVVATPPALVVVPGTSVYQVPSASFNLFVFGDRYYSFHNGVWFQGRTHNGPWVVIAESAVPRPVLGVPVTYYKIPPGHAKRLKREREREREESRGCPPGPARQGRC